MEIAALKGRKRRMRVFWPKCNTQVTGICVRKKDFKQKDSWTLCQDPVEGFLKCNGSCIQIDFVYILSAGNYKAKRQIFLRCWIINWKIPYALVVMNYQWFGKSKWSVVCRLAKWASKLSIVTCRVASSTGDPYFIYIVAILIIARL